MIATSFYKGMGTGNQLANYVTVRCLALDKGFDFGVQYPENFKGSSFLNLDMGLPVTGGRTDVEGQPPQELPDGFNSYYREKSSINELNVDVSGYDEDLKNIEDGTLIHGILQGVKYFEHRRDEIDQLLAVEPLEMDEYVCVINFRGGEYKFVKDFFLSEYYWRKAIIHMKKKNPTMTFEVHTDDAETARTFFPDFKIVQDIALNWRSIRYAKYLILSNSSFAILPAWLNKDAYVIAPKYWGRHNVSDGYWSCEQNQVEGWHYQDKEGNLQTICLL